MPSNDKETILEGATKEEQNETLRTYENDILGGLLKAADFGKDEDEVKTVQIARGGTVLFTFHIHPLTEEQYNKCRERYTKYVRHKQLGIKIPENTDTTKYRNALIYEATTPEDRAAVWDNKDAWRKLDVLTGTDLIEKVLKAGEKDAILDLIDKISGYSVTEEELAKN